MWRLVPVVLSLVVLGAHFLRARIEVLVVGTLVLLGLLAVPRPWAARIVQAGLVLGALEWLRTLVTLVAARMEAGQPALRMAIILGSVALLTGASALVFRSVRLARYYATARREP